jgi:hypothetical protein
MARYPIDGQVRVAFVPTIASMAAPTAASEMVAGGVAELTANLTADGFSVNITEDSKDRTTLASTFNAVAQGRAGGDMALTYFRDSITGTDKPYATLKSGTLGFIVVRFGVLYSTAWTAGDKVRVYPIQCGLQKDVPAAKNTDWQIAQMLYITDAWVIDGVLA